MRVAVEVNGVVVLVVNGGGASYIYNQGIVPEGPLFGERLLPLLLLWLSGAFTRQPVSAESRMDTLLSLLPMLLL